MIPTVSERGPSIALTAVPLAVWAGLIVLTHFLGLPIVHRKPRTGIFVPPLVARFDARFPPRALIPIAVAVLVLALVPLLSARIGWPWLLLVAFAAAGLWAVSLALVDGLGELTRPIRDTVDYLHNVPLVGSPGEFLSHFVERVGRYQQHVRAHPPGMVLLLWTMDRIGLGGARWAASLEILGGASMVPAALICLKELSGEARARAAAPFVALAPMAVWVATSGDAFFAGVSTWAVTLIVLSIRRATFLSDALAFGGGLLFGGVLMLSYGLVLLALVPLIVAIWHRRVRPLVVAAFGTALVILAFAAAGFWWFAGLRATLVEYRASVARFRPQGYFWLGNLGAFAVVLGPATAVALARLRDRRTWLLVAGALLGVVIADVSGLSKAEVERIWLPFAPWIVQAGWALVEPFSPRPFAPVAARLWLGLTLGTGLAVQLLLRTVW